MMALPICSACGLRQTLRAPRCARCGAPLDDSQSSPVSQPPGAEDRLTDTELTPAPDAAWAAVAGERWQRFWLRIAGNSPRPDRRNGQWSRWAPSPERRDDSDG